jgi:hypothetical protein
MGIFGDEFDWVDCIEERVRNFMAENVHVTRDEMKSELCRRFRLDAATAERFLAPPSPLSTWATAVYRELDARGVTPEQAAEGVRRARGK